MLSARRNSDGQTVTAYFESKANGPFACLQCNDPVILKTGRGRVNHFAHANPIACKFAEGESDGHRQCKMEIFEALQRTPGVHDAALERALGEVRPDVSALINGVPVAIEVQISSLSLDTIMRRTIEYARKDIYVLWLLQWTQKLDAGRYAPRLWEKWVHAAYFGRVYYWIEGLTVVSYSFDPHFTSVPKISWYSEKGKKLTGGGYSRRSKRYRTAVRSQTLNLATDFGPKERYWWEGNGLKVPDAKLFMHRDRYSPPPMEGGSRWQN
jgi:competence protein CoiA